MKHQIWFHNHNPALLKLLLKHEIFKDSTNTLFAMQKPSNKLYN